MRRVDEFLVFSVLFAAFLFVVYLSPPLIYLGLLYSMMLFLTRDRIQEKRPELDTVTILGVALILISPVFLIIKFGEYPSPATFQALVLIGLSLVLFKPRTILGPNAIALFELLLAVAVRSNTVSDAIAWTSDIFVDLTSYLVRGLIDLFKVPIIMKENIAVVRNSVVVIGSGCSGLDAFILYLLASVLLIYLRKSGRREATLLLLGALGIIPLNALRIFTLLVIGYHSGISFLELFHSHLGDLMFVVYVFGYWWLVLKGPKKHQDTSGENRGIKIS